MKTHPTNRPPSESDRTSHFRIDRKFWQNKNLYVIRASFLITTANAWESTSLQYEETKLVILSLRILLLSQFYGYGIILSFPLLTGPFCTILLETENRTLQAHHPIATITSDRHGIIIVGLTLHILWPAMKPTQHPGSCRLKRLILIRFSKVAIYNITITIDRVPAFKLVSLTWLLYGDFDICTPALSLSLTNRFCHVP